MENMVRISAALPEIRPCAVEVNTKRILKLISRLDGNQPDIIAFPAYCLSGASCGAMFNSKGMASKIKAALLEIAEATKENKAYIILGIPKISGESEAVVIYRGEIIKTVDKYSEKPVITKGEFSFMIHLGSSDDFVGKSIDDNIDLIISMSAIKSKVGTRKRETDFYKSYSRAKNVAVAVVNGNIGETTSPYIYNPFAFIVEGGEMLFETTYDEQTVTGDIDLDIIKSGKSADIDMLSNESFSTPFGFFRNPKCNPFLPADVTRRRSALDEMFDFQVQSLVSRMKATEIKKLVLGVSGGVDSTLALMVAVKALDELKYSRNSLIGITMPGFGTNDRTYYNALKLIVGFKAELREIPIKGSVMKHFEDIGHNPEIHNTTFENAQARERAQILLDIANTENAIIVGTGDLSENALGWFTFGGDQIAHFNVNESIPKTVVKEIINRQMSLAPFEAEADLLSDIVLTPISPELLPSDNGDFSQKTESIIGPYELHDFFIYYFVKYGFSPEKLYEYACHTFFGVYDKKQVLDTMKIFFKRFFSNQFKRNANPDSANFGEVSLAGVDMNFPSDLDVTALIAELDTLNKKEVKERNIYY